MTITSGPRSEETRSAVDTPAGRFTLRTAGDPSGELVLLLHGFPRTSHLFRHLLGPIAASGRFAVAVDQRGYSAGARPAEVEGYTVSHLAEDVTDIATALGAPRFHLVGHDWGGTVAWLVAGTHPDRVASLCVLSTPHPAAFGRAMAASTSGQSQRSAYMDVLRSPMAEAVFLAEGGTNLRSLLGGPGLTPEDVEEYFAVLRDPPAFTGALNWYRANSAPSGQAPTVDVPVLHVSGSEDHAFDAGVVAASAAYVGGQYQLLRLEGAGHFLPEECPERFVEELLEHLGTHPAV